MPGLRMVHLLTVSTEFQARVVAARLGSEGIVTELRGAVGGPYPVGDVLLYVSDGDFDLSRQLLLADEVEAAFDISRDGERRPVVAPWLAVTAIVLIGVLSLLTRLL